METKKRISIKPFGKFAKLCLALLVYCFFCACSARPQHGELEYFSYNKHGSNMESSDSYQVQRNADSTTATITINEGSPSEIVINDAPATVLGVLQQIVDRHKMNLYKESYKSETEALDGDSWTFSLKYADKTHVDASGYMAYPEGGEAAFKEVCEYFKKYRTQSTDSGISTKNENLNSRQYFATNTDKIMQMWRDSEDLEGQPEKYVFIDIDGDGNDELYLRNDENNEGCLMAFDGNKINIVATEDFKMKLSFYRNFICQAGSAGSGGSYYQCLVELKNSKVVRTESELSYNGASDDERIYEYGEGVDPADAKAFFARLPEKPLNTDGLTWQPFSKLKTKN